MWASRSPQTEGLLLFGVRIDVVTDARRRLATTAAENEHTACEPKRHRAIMSGDRYIGGRGGP
jgi:hypothetical protein